MNRYVTMGFCGAAAALISLSGLDAAAQTRGTGAARPAMAAQGASSTTALGPVRITRAVTADGKPLPVGTYVMRVTQNMPDPPAAGQTPQAEVWAEFLQGGQVKGREVATVVADSDIKAVAKMKPPASGTYRVDVLKGDEYLRLWFNKAGTHYLVHFPLGGKS